MTVKTNIPETLREGVISNCGMRGGSGRGKEEGRRKRGQRGEERKEKKETHWAKRGRGWMNE